MKKSIINKTLAFASSALLASCFVACSPDVEDTTANYAEKEKAVTTTTDADSHTAKGGSVYISNINGTSYSYDYNQTIDTASKDTQITVSIESYAKIDESSVLSAVGFYTLSDNTENKYYYPVRGSALSKDLLHTTEPSSYSYGGTTTFLFNVDTSSVNTNKIAVVVDATKLKDKSGNAVLNLDEDDVAGEETDSYIDYITVSEKSDGTTETTALNNRFDEEFDNAYLSSSVSKSDLKDDDGNLTGKIRFTVRAPEKSYSFSDTGVRTTAYDDSLASSLASIYKLQTKAPNATSWSDVALSFTYHADSDAVGTVNRVYENTYTADTEALAYGTQYRLVRTNITSGSAPSEYAKYYGHAAYFFYCGSKEYSEVVGFYNSTTYQDDTIFTSTVYTASPTNIYDFGTTAATSTDFDATDDYTYEQAFLMQNELLSFEETEKNGKWWVSLNNGEFESATDFIVTDAYNSKVESSVRVVTGGDNRIIGVEIELKNKNVVGNYKVWVGNGTTLKSNPAYPTQKKFGVPADSSKGDVGGYVALLNFETVHNSASSDIDDFVLTNVESTEYIDYFVSLRADTLYTILIANGYNNSSLVGACDYGAVSVTDLDGYTIIDNEYRKSSVTFTPAEDGVYKVRVRSKYSGYSGYVGFYIYKETIHTVSATEPASSLASYTVVNVNGTNYIDYYYSFESGKLYQIQIANGYNSSLSGACDYGAVSVTELDGRSLVGEDYESDTLTFCPTESGIYKVRVRSASYSSSGKVGFYIYEKTVSSVDDAAASTSISDYTLAQISSSNPSEDFYYTLEAGSYSIQPTNGYSLLAGDTLLSDSGNVPACYYGKVEVYRIGSDGDAEHFQTVNYEDSDANFTVYTSGIYCIRIIKPDAGEDGQVYVDEDGNSNENVNMYDGYVGFHIYKN